MRILDLITWYEELGPVKAVKAMDFLNYSLEDKPVAEVYNNSNERAYIYMYGLNAFIKRGDGIKKHFILKETTAQNLFEDYVHENIEKFTEELQNQLNETTEVDFQIKNVSFM